MGGQIITLGERCLIRAPFLSQQATRILGLNPGLPRRVSVSLTCPLVHLCLSFETSTHPEFSRSRFQQKLQINKTRGELEFSMRPSCLEASEASSGSGIPQKIIDVVIPVKISNKVRMPTDAPSLEEALCIPLLEGN